MLTMVLMVPSTYLLSTGETRDTGEGITRTYFASLEAKPDEAQHYRFYAFWEKEDPRWSSLEEIKSYLLVEADRLKQSIIYLKQ